MIFEDDTQARRREPLKTIRLDHPINCMLQHEGTYQGSSSYRLK